MLCVLQWHSCVQVSSPTAANRLLMIDGFILKDCMLTIEAVEQKASTSSKGVEQKASTTSDCLTSNVAVEEVNFPVVLENLPLALSEVMTK